MIVYKTINLINGKFYVGKQASTSKWYLGSGKALKSAIKKYGRENFKKEVLEVCTSLQHLDEREIFWIKELNAVELGYNIAEGGTGGSTGGKGGVKKGNIPWNKGTKGVMKAWNKGTKGVMKANSTTFKPGREHPLYGKNQSRSTVDKRVKNNPNKRKVRYNKTGQIYESIAAASRATGFPIARISEDCRGKTKLNRFQYVD